MGTSFNQAVTAAIRDAMQERALTQTAAAAALGLRQSALSRRLSGEIPWRTYEIEALADLFAIPASTLLQPRQVSA